MPRGRKPLNVKSIDVQISDIDSEIEEYKQKIVQAKEKRKMLESRREKQDMAALYEAVKASGKSAHDFLESLQSHAE